MDDTGETADADAGTPSGYATVGNGFAGFVPGRVRRKFRTRPATARRSRIGRELS